MRVDENDLVEDSNNEDLFGKRDFRKKKDKKRLYKTMKEKDDNTTESFKKMKEEIDELRRKESERTR